MLSTEEELGTLTRDVYIWHIASTDRDHQEILRCVQERGLATTKR